MRETIMGMRSGSSSTFDYPPGYCSWGKINQEAWEQKNETLPNPDPKNYRVLKSEQINSYLLLVIIYPDCTNYEGRKILLFKNVTLQQLFDQKLIDPHFSNNKQYKSPIARFEPTENGWELGKQFVNFLEAQNGNN